MATFTNINAKVSVWLDKFFVWPILLYRFYRFGSAFRKIDLGEGYFTIIDLDDYYRLKQYQWWVHGNGQELYAVRSTVSAPGKTRIISMHREIMNAPPGLLVDHKHGNTLDNRKSELRLATRSQNQFNKRKTKSKTSSQYKGVFYDKVNKKWGAHILFKRKYRWLGRFETEIEAAKAYDKAAKKYFGEFARLNFPERSVVPRVAF